MRAADRHGGSDNITAAVGVHRIPSGKAITPENLEQLIRNGTKLSSFEYSVSSIRTVNKWNRPVLEVIPLQKSLGYPEGHYTQHLVYAFTENERVYEVQTWLTADDDTVKAAVQEMFDGLRFE